MTASLNDAERIKKSMAELEVNFYQHCYSFAFKGALQSAFMLLHPFTGSTLPSFYWIAKMANNKEISPARHLYGSSCGPSYLQTFYYVMPSKNSEANQICCIFTLHEWHSVWNSCFMYLVNQKELNMLEDVFCREYIYALI